jgi:hypothetical protein
MGMGNSPAITGHPNFGSVLFTFSYTFIILWLIVAVRATPDDTPRVCSADTLSLG